MKKERLEMLIYRRLLIMILAAVVILSSSNICLMAKEAQTGENGGIVTNNYKPNYKIIKIKKYFSSLSGKVIKVKISGKKSTIKKGVSLKLRATVQFKNNDSGIGKKGVIWSCNGKGEIKSCNGTSCTIVGKKKGKLKVTAKSKQKPSKSKTITIRVK